jgi:hypothetical protein
VKRILLSFFITVPFSASVDNLDYEKKHTDAKGEHYRDNTQNIDNRNIPHLFAPLLDYI